LLDGTVKKMGSAAAGLLLLVLGFTWPAAIHPVTVLIVVGIVGLTIAILRRDYAEALNRKITGRSRRGKADHHHLSLDDASTRHILDEMLDHQDPDRVLGALKLLLDSEFDLTTRLPSLLGHEDERIRLQAIDWASRQRGQQLWPRLEDLVLHSPDRRTRAAASRALLQIDPLRTADLLDDLVDDKSTDPALRNAGIEALFACPERRQRAEQLVLNSSDFIRSGPAGHRREFSRLLGNLPDGPWSVFLLELLDDEEESVVRLAATSCGKLQLMAAVPKLAEALTRRPVRQTARHALATYGDQITDLVKEWLNDTTISLKLRQEIPRLLRLIGSAKAAQVLLRSNPDDDPFLQYRVANALSRLIADRPWLASGLDAAWTHAAIERQIRYLFELRQRGAALAVDPERFDLLYRSVISRHAQVLDICLKLFALGGDRKLIGAVTRALVHGDRASRGDALELLDLSLGHHPLKQQLLSELERADVTLEPSASHEVACAIASGHDRTLAAIAGRCLARSGLPRPAPDANILMEDLMSDELIDRIFLLQRVELFSELNIDELAAISDLARSEYYEPGQAIYREHDPSSALFVIVNGDVSFHRDGRFLLRLGAFESFGQVGFLDRLPRPASATAARRSDGVTVLVIDRQDFLDLVADRVEVLNGLFKVLTRRLRELVQASTGPGYELAAGQTATLPAIKLNG
jgi:CRP-like cAMP-binding protein/HEAT repeat protein